MKIKIIETEIEADVAKADTAKRVTKSKWSLIYFKSAKNKKNEVIAKRIPEVIINIVKALRFLISKNAKKQIEDNRYKVNKTLGKTLSRYFN